MMSEEEGQEMELGMDEVLKLIEQRFNDIEDHRIYYSLRDMKVRWIGSSGREMVKFCVAIDEMGLPITTPLVATLMDKAPSNVRTSLHHLGDKKIITLIHGGKSPIQKWFLSSIYKECYYEGARIIDGELVPRGNEEEELEEPEDDFKYP